MFFPRGGCSLDLGRKDADVRVKRNRALAGGRNVRYFFVCFTASLGVGSDAGCGFPFLPLPLPESPGCLPPALLKSSPKGLGSTQAPRTAPAPLQQPLEQNWGFLPCSDSPPLNIN